MNNAQKTQNAIVVANAVELGNEIVKELAGDVLDTSSVESMREVVAVKLNRNLQLRAEKGA